MTQQKPYLYLKIYQVLHSEIEELLSNGMQLITRKRKNMKEMPTLTVYEKQLLKQRGIIETGV
jgi:hypothetical protein